jgi:23S rRNA-/tRNA-specific pseudouridylate synthase/SAM-dependent methyltransferase
MGARGADRAEPRPAGRWLARGIPIVHEDDEILVVEKPPGLLTANMPGETRDSLFDTVKEYARRKNRRAKAWIIHRLDKEASGLLVFGKTERAFAWLKEDFKTKRVHRIYLAVVEGQVGGGDGSGEPGSDGATGRRGDEGTESQRHEGTEGKGDHGSAGGAKREGEPPRRRVKQLPSGTIQSYLREDGTGPVRSVGVGEVAKESARYTSRPWRGERPRPGRGPRERAARFEPEAADPGAPRLAVTHYRVLAVGNGRSLVQLRLETGRKNQIRAHMKEFGHPIVGDRRYGAATDPTGRVCLHATELGFERDRAGLPSRFFSPAPAGFYRLVGQKPPPVSQQREQAESFGAEPLEPRVRPAAETSWDQVAGWYDELIEEDRSDHFGDVILPGTLALLGAVEGKRVLDVACGQGALARRLTEAGASVVGVDASPRLIEAARKRATAEPTEKGRRADQSPAARFEVGDARDLPALRGLIGEEPFDAAVCVMALMNIDPVGPVFRGVGELLRPGGVLVAVILHPAFRAPGRTAWGWERNSASRAAHRALGESGPAGQYRRVDAYLSAARAPIVMNPGSAARGGEAVETFTFHRPLRDYFAALAGAGFVVEALEEWASQRRSEPGPRAEEENRARREIPMFLGLRAVRR